MLEIKRRLIWLWRLACSSLQLDSDGHGRAAIWLFDTRDQPDGEILKKYVEEVAVLENLKLFSFGPRKLTLSLLLHNFVRFFSVSHLAVSSRFRDEFPNLIVKALSTATQLSQAEILLVGSIRGTFAKHSLRLFSQSCIWEIQHGFPNDSYFPLNVGRFFSRSAITSPVVRRLAPGVIVTEIAGDLTPPKGTLVTVNPTEVTSLVCFSKNPGGSCTWEELAQFERACMGIAARLKLPMFLRLHPRDNILKLFIRHRSLKPLRFALRPRSDRLIGPRLIISAFSTALMTASRPGDLLTNVWLGSPSPLTVEQYSWLPSYRVESTSSIHDAIFAFRRA
jgi:hypothetical protein